MFEGERRSTDWNAGWAWTTWRKKKSYCGKTLFKFSPAIWIKVKICVWQSLRKWVIWVCEKNRESVMCENVCVREKVKVREWKRPCESERVKVSVLKCELGWILKRLREREREGVGCVLVRGWKVMSVGKWGGCETRCGQTVHVSQSQVKRNICLNK